MKTLAIALLGLCGSALSTDLAAQNPAKFEKYEKLYQKKLEAPWLKKARWITDYDEAKRLAAAQDKVIFAYFSRSYSP